MSYSLLLLALLGGCGPSASGEAFDACVDGYKMRCRCGDFTSNAADATADCEQANDEEKLYEACERYDLRKCEPNLPQWDAEGCDEAKDASENWLGNEAYDYHRCVGEAYEAECPGPDVSHDDWLKLRERAGRECVDLLPE